jgi:hypothetical protein
MKSNLVPKKSEIAKLQEKFGKELVDGLCRQFLEEGIVNPNGKTGDEVIKELMIETLKWSKQRPMMMAIDHKSGLLKQARAFAKEEAFEESFLFYATWFEHWINGVLTRRSRKLDEDGRRQMLRETSLKGKFRWLLPILHSAEVPRSHLNTIIRIAEMRNSFVHYKFVMDDVEEWSKKDSEALIDIKRAEQTIKFLKRFETKLFLTPDSKKAISKLKRGRKPKHQDSASMTNQK